MEREREAETVAEFVEHMLKTAKGELEACFFAVMNTSEFSDEELHNMVARCRSIQVSVSHIQEQIMLKSSPSTQPVKESSDE